MHQKGFVLKMSLNEQSPNGEQMKACNANMKRAIGVFF